MPRKRERDTDDLKLAELLELEALGEDHQNKLLADRLRRAAGRLRVLASIESRSYWGVPPLGRAQIEMDTAEYERMRDALGPDWEWQGVVRIREGST